MPVNLMNRLIKNDIRELQKAVEYRWEVESLGVECY